MGGNFGTDALIADAKKRTMAPEGWTEAAAELAQLRQQQQQSLSHLSQLGLNKPGSGLSQLVSDEDRLKWQQQWQPQASQLTQLQAAQMANAQYNQIWTNQTSTAGALLGGIGASTGQSPYIATTDSSGLFSIDSTSYQQWSNQAFGSTLRWKQVAPDEWQSDEYQETWTDLMGKSTLAPNRPSCPSCGDPTPVYKGTFDRHNKVSGTVRFRRFHCRRCKEQFTDSEKGMRLRINLVIEELRQRVRDFKI